MTVSEPIKNVTETQNRFVLKLKALDPTARYALTSSESVSSWEASGTALMEGVPVTLEKHSADIWFYRQL